MSKKSELSLGLNLVNDCEMERLNKIFRGMKKPSNVITFSLNERVKGRLILGEIVIDLDEAKREASLLGISIKEELLRLVTHGARNLIREINLKS